MAKTPRAAKTTHQRPGIRSGIAFLIYVFSRFRRDHGQERSAALTFTSLLALVPLLAISFAIFAAFPAFQNMKGEVQSFVFQNFVPEIGSVVYDHIEQFTSKTGQLTAVGVIFLAVTSIMLLSSINNTFNNIWKVRESRPLVGRLLVYWAVLTLSPMLFGASLSLSSYLFAAAQATGVEQFTGPLSRLAGFVPLVLQVVGFSILYMVMPSYPVRRRDALIGGLAAGLLFELLKKGFGLYVTNFPTYETLYGALSAFPILLVWMYVAWVVVLFGAQMTAAMPEWRAGVRTVTQSTIPAARLLAAALSLLHALHVTSLKGGGLSMRRMARAAPAAPEAVAVAQVKLERSRYITRADNARWLLSRDLEAMTLADLKRDMGLDLDISDLRYIPTYGWGRRYSEIIRNIDEADAEFTSITLRDLLAPDSEAEIIEFPDPEDEDHNEDGEEITDRKTRFLALLGLTVLSRN